MTRWTLIALALATGLAGCGVRGDPERPIALAATAGEGRAPQMTSPRT